MGARPSTDPIAPRDLRAVLDGAYDLLDVPTRADLPAATLEIVARLVPCDIVSYNEVDLDRRAAWSVSAPAEVVPEDGPALLAAHAADNPLVVHQATTGDGSARRVSDFISLRQFRSRPLHVQLYAPMGVNHQLAIGFGVRPGVIGVALNRGRMDFSDRDVAVLDALRPFVSYAHRRLPGPPPSEAGLKARLTRRQQEILELVAGGATNVQIAAALTVSEHTVAKHLERIYRLLGVTNRTGAVAAWREVS